MIHIIERQANDAAGIDVYVYNVPAKGHRKHLAYDACMYALGITKPNYPLPAIVTETSLWRNCFMLFKGNETEPFKMWFK